MHHLSFVFLQQAVITGERKKEIKKEKISENVSEAK